MEGRNHASFLNHFSSLRQGLSLNLKLKDLSRLAEQQAPRTSSYCFPSRGVYKHKSGFSRSAGDQNSAQQALQYRSHPHNLPKYFLYKASLEARRRHCCYCLPGLPNTWYLNATYWFSPDSNSFSNKINVKKKYFKTYTYISFQMTQIQILLLQIPATWHITKFTYSSLEDYQL